MNRALDRLYVAAYVVGARLGVRLFYWLLAPVPAHTTKGQVK